MIHALLDGGGFLSDRNSISRDGRILNDFSNLVKLEFLDVVPFVSPEDYKAWHRNPSQKGSAKGLIERTIRSVVRWDGSDCEATLFAGPEDLSPTWKRALRDAVTKADSWRTPQIVIPTDRRATWPASEEVEIRLEPCDGSASVVARRIVIADLENYSGHLHARADANPWDLRHVHPVPQGARIDHPCLLPMPPTIVRTLLSELQRKLLDLGWEDGDCRYYIPSDEWDPLSIDQTTWRAGRTFPHKFENRKHGPLDKHGRIWHWDIVERHWDVQMGGANYLRVSHTGKIL